MEKENSNKLNSTQENSVTEIVDNKQETQNEEKTEFDVESAKILLDQHIDSLLKVFICEKERHKQIGALCINLDYKENNTYYTNIEMLSPKDPMRLKLLELYKKNYNIAVFYLFDKNGELYSVLDL